MKDVQEIITVSWEKVLNIDNINIDDDFFTIGGNSYKALLSVLYINDKINNPNINISILDFYNNTTIRNLTNFILGNGQSTITLLNEYKKVENKDLFLFPSIIGSPIVLNDVIPYLNNYNCYGVNFEFMTQSIHDLSDKFFEEIININDANNKTINLLGYSYGAIFCYEIIKKLNAKGYLVNFVVIDTIPNGAEYYGWDEEYIKDYFSKTLEDKNIIYELSMYGIQSQLTDKDSFEYLKDRALYKLNQLYLYKPETKIECNVLLIEAEENLNLRYKIAMNKTIYEVWKSYVDGEITHRHISGNHYTIVQKNNGEQLATIINNWLK